MTGVPARRGGPARDRGLAEKVVRRLAIRTRLLQLRLDRRDRPAQRRDDVVVSLTTHPGRVRDVRPTLLSLLTQDVRPRVVRLVLSAEEFQPDTLPADIAALVERGLDVHFDPGNARSYKKLLPTLRDFGDHTVVTADDDVLYPTNWLTGLLAEHDTHPGDVLGYRCVEVQLAGAELAPYVTWPEATRNSPPARVMATGRDGVLYPPGSLHERVTDLGEATRLCPTTDDVWFKAMSLLRGTGTRALDPPHRDFLPNRSEQGTALNAANNGAGENDRQLRQVLTAFDLWDRLRG